MQLMSAFFEASFSFIFDGMTPLLFAAQYGDVAVVKTLLNEKNVSVNQSNVGKMAALHLAVMKGQVRVASQLISCKADVNALDTNDSSPLHYAAQYGHLSCLKLLLEQPETKPNLRNRIGYTPLHLAVQNGHLAVVSVLSQTPGVDRNIVDNASVCFFGYRTPLQSAQARGLHDITECLTPVRQAGLLHRD
jgi:ankyrin repeat protein